MQATPETPTAAAPVPLSAPPRNDKLRRSDRGHGTAEGGRRRDERADRQRRRKRGLQRDRLHVQFDPNVLQVRAGTQGDWAVAVGVNPRFAAEISAAEDRVQIRSAVSGRGRPGRRQRGHVQFQAVTTGTTSVLITDVVIKDSSGRSMVPSVSASNLQVTADSCRRPNRSLAREARRHRRAAGRNHPGRRLIESRPAPTGRARRRAVCSIQFDDKRRRFRRRT
jgi:hypothetical protein